MGRKTRKRKRPAPARSTVAKPGTGGPFDEAPAPLSTARMIRRAVSGYLGVVAVLGLGALLNNVVPPDLSLFWFFAIAIAALGGIGLTDRLVNGRWATAIGWMVVAAIGALVVMIFGWFAVGDVLLDARGQEVTAVVTTAQLNHTGRDNPYYTYVLRRLDGSPIAGQLEPSGARELAVGTKLTVLVDPDGIAAPEVPSDIHTERNVALGVVALAILGVGIGMITVADDGPRRHRPATTTTKGHPRPDRT